MNSVEIFFALIRNIIFNKPVPDGISDHITESMQNTLYRSSKAHDLSALIYAALIKNGIALNEDINAKFNQLKTQQRETNIRYDLLKCSYNNLKENNKTLKNKEKEILSSKSWKITSPLRKIRNINKKK